MSREQLIDQAALESASYRRATVRLPKDGEVETMRAAQRAAAEGEERREAEHRESLRGRASGFLLVAWEAIDQRVKDAPEDAMAKWLWHRLYTVKDGLETAERDLLRAAEALRSQAVTIERAVQQDSSYNSLSGYVMGSEYRDAEARRVAYREQGQPLIELVARHLGIDYADVIRPMAKREDGAK